MNTRDGGRITTFWSAHIRGSAEGDPLLSADRRFLLRSDPRITSVWSAPIRTLCAVKREKSEELHSAYQRWELGAPAKPVFRYRYWGSLNFPTGISVSVPIPVPDVFGTGIGTDTEIRKNTSNLYSRKSAKIGTITDFGLSTDFGTSTGVQIASIFPHSSIGTDIWKTKEWGIMIWEQHIIHWAL